MPVYKEGKDKYNCYTSGMYITDFKQEIINDDYNLVTMNVYNETSVIGVVEVYDSNGKLVKCEKIDKCFCYRMHLRKICYRLKVNGLPKKHRYRYQCQEAVI